MATNVYANGEEISCKTSKGKTSVAFPDPCWSLLPTRSTILPYPNVAQASSLKKGTTTVLIKGGMVALEDRSFFSADNGNEPASQAFQKGLLAQKSKGRTYYQKWSQNVKFEGKGVCRNFDLMTHNHGSFPGNTVPFPYLSGAIGNATNNDSDREKQKQAMAKYCKKENNGGDTKRLRTEPSDR